MDIMTNSQVFWWQPMFCHLELLNVDTWSHLNAFYNLSFEIEKYKRPNLGHQTPMLGWVLIVTRCIIQIYYVQYKFKFTSNKFKLIFKQVGKQVGRQVG